jgi:hypothetical protein
MFFAKRDPVYQTMRRIAKKFDKAGIPYAIVGAMAVNAHGFRRTTADLDILLTPHGFEEFRRRFVEKDFAATVRRRRFIDRKNEVIVDILLTGMYPGSGMPGPIAFPDPIDVSDRVEETRVINLATLIQLKLAARRHKDFGDVVELIRVHDLDESFQRQLHASVCRDYVECLEEKRREDEYEARND